MNRQGDGKGKRGIEWTDYTWNPVGGCQHACRWIMPDSSIAKCYAETVAEGVARAAYPDGFKAHYWRPDALNEPRGLVVPSRIFMDSMSDLMGHWVPNEQIEAVLDTCRKAPQHTFQLLTKNAPRLLQFTFPPNVWVGVSMPPTEMFGKPLTFHQQEHYMRRALDVLGKVDVPVRWMSFEPLSWDVSEIVARYSESNLAWAVIGAASNGRTLYQPKAQWVTNLHRVLDRRGVPIFHKGNLNWQPHREEFPDSPNAVEAQPAKQMELF